MRLSTATVETSVTEMQSPILWTERQEAKFRLVHLKRRTESRTESKRKSLTDIIITPARGPLLEAKIDHRQVTGGGGWFAFFENHMHLTGWSLQLGGPHSLRATLRLALHTQKLKKARENKVMLPARKRLRPNFYRKNGIAKISARMPQSGYPRVIYDRLLPCRWQSARALLEELEEPFVEKPGRYTACYSM